MVIMKHECADVDTVADGGVMKDTIGELKQNGEMESHPSPVKKGEHSSHTSNKIDQEDYKSDEFRMWRMKVVPCAKRYVHDWTECPFAHPKEKATRRDPKKFNYTGIACPSMKKDSCCTLGEQCPYAHNVFEYWLHPTRYRTQMCNDGESCRRKICFFAHKEEELRVPETKPFVAPEMLASAAANMASMDRLMEDTSMAQVVPQPDIMFYQPRMSWESVRQSQDWGPVPMPRNIEETRRSLGLASSDSRAFLDAQFMQSENSSGSVELEDTKYDDQSSLNQEKFIIDKVTGMMTEEKISAQQAAIILQQLLPQASVERLKMALRGSGVGQQGSPHSGKCEGSLPASPVLQSLGPERMVPIEHLAALQAISSGFGKVDQRTANIEDEKYSIGSSRSSFDAMRTSLEARRDCPNSYLANALENDIGSEYGYKVPAAAYPQFWTSSNPMSSDQDRPDFIQTTRKSTGSIGNRLSSSFGGDLAHQFGRVSVGERKGNTRNSLQHEENAFDPFVSSLFRSVE